MNKPLPGAILSGIALALAINVNGQPTVSGISVSSITASSAVINWTTNVPATSKVNYGTTVSYGMHTLTDQTAVSSHAMILNSLAPGTLYHFQVISRNANGTVTSSDVTFSTAPIPAASGTLDTHGIQSYPTGKIIPWMSNPSLCYDSVMKLAWNYLLNNVPNDPSTGKPAYYSQSFIYPNDQSMGNWPHNPAGLYAMLIESALKYYAYSGNANVVQLAINVATWQLDHGMTTASDNWASVPYAQGLAGSTTYGGSSSDGGPGYLEPDKIGELGNGWLQLYKYNGNIRFRDAAIQCANVLAAKVRIGNQTQSPWPFRVNAHNGGVHEEYCSNTIAPIILFDNLIAAGLGNVNAYQTARTTAWNWMMTYPMQNNVWAQYFEDVGPQQNYNTNLNQYNAGMTARYLLEHPEFDPQWEAHARGIITWVENTFGVTQNGAIAIKEQIPVFPWLMGSHTSRFASVNALLYEKTGDLVAKEKAYRSFNWATYMTRNNGIVIDGPLYGSYTNANQWWTDGYGDYVRHFMTGLGAVPEWTPSYQTRILRSSSVIKNVTYGLNNISYTTFDANSTEVIHVNFDPGAVTVNGTSIPRRSDLSQPGWTLDVETKTIRIYHNTGTLINITAADNAALPVTLGEFTATLRNNNAVQLDWKTYSEYNSKEFVIERSVDGNNFETIQVMPAAGNSTTTRNYGYTDDRLPQSSVLYYRLKQVDIDGQFQYSRVVQVKLKRGNFYINTIFPSPAADVVHVRLYNGNASTPGTISIINMNGSVVKRSIVMLNTGDNTLDLNITALAKGVYMMRINAGAEQLVERLVKE